MFSEETADVSAVKLKDGLQGVGERCKSLGPAQFKKLVGSYRWDEAMEVCLAHVYKMINRLTCPASISIQI